jgi:thioredoxin 1
MIHTVKNLGESNFSGVVSRGVALVDFWATWCGPCRQQLPILEAVAARLGGGAVIAKVNVDEWPSIAGHYGVQSIPTLLLFKDGREVERFVGLQSEVTLLTAVEKLMDVAVSGPTLNT